MDFRIHAKAAIRGIPSGTKDVGVVSSPGGIKQQQKRRKNLLYPVGPSVIYFSAFMVLNVADQRSGDRLKYFQGWYIRT